MAVSTTNAISGPFTTNGVTVTFPFTFTAPSASEVAVLLRDAAGTITTAGGYDVALTTGGGGSVTFDTAPATGSTLYIVLDPSFTQDIEFENGSAWLAGPVNEANDRAAARDQYLKARIDLLAPHDILAANAAGDLAGNFYAWDAEGNPTFASGTGNDSAFRTDVAAPTGSSLVGFLQSGTGAVARSVLAKAREAVTPKDFGAAGDFANDDTAGLQAANDAFGILGGELELNQASRFMVTEVGATNRALTLTGSVSLVGKGSVYSAISPGPGVAAGVTVVTVDFDPDIIGWFNRHQNYFIGNPFSGGSRTGGVGLQLLTGTGATAGISAGRFLMDGVGIAPGNDVALEHINNTAIDTTGGLYTSEFRRNLFGRGARMIDHGDSLLFTTNTTWSAGAGFETTATIDAQGNMPSQVIFLNHNSTSEDGAFLFHRGRWTTVLHSNLEQTVANAAGVLVDFRGDTGPNNSTGIWAPVLQSTLLAATGAWGLSTFASFGSCSGGYVWNCAFTDGAGGAGAAADIIISANTHDLWVGPNLSFRTDLLITDNGVGTRGVTKSATKANGWVDVGVDTEPLQFTKSLDGLVTIWGACKNGTTAAGTVLFTLPVGFRPGLIMRATITVDDGGSFTVPGHLLLQANGQVQIGYVPTAGGAAAQKMFVSFSFRAAHANTIKIQTPLVV